MRFSTILSFYIGRQFVKAFLGAIGIIMGLIFLFDVIELLRRASTHGNATFAQLLELAALKLPQMVETILPFAIMAGALACFWSLTRSRELVVIRSAGVSAWQFLAPVLLAAAAIGVLNVTAFNPLSARTFVAYERLEDQLALRGQPSSQLQVGENGLWLREDRGIKQMIVHASSVRQEGYVLKLRGVNIFFTNAAGDFVYRVDGTLGSLSGGAFHLTGVRVVRGGVPVEHMKNLDISTTLTLARVEDSFAAPETISFWRLPEFIAFFESAGFSASRQKLYFQSLLASPLLLCAMVLVAAAFSLNPNLRSGGVTTRLVGAVVTGFVFYFFSKVVYTLGMSATLPVPLAAWTPTVVTGLAGTGALFHLEDG